MAISKEQPMRPALIDVVEFANGQGDDIEQLQELTAEHTEQIEAITDVQAEFSKELQAEIENRTQADDSLGNTLEGLIEAETERAQGIEQTLGLRIDELEAEEHFYLYDFNIEYEEKNVLPISDPTPITGTNRFSVVIPQELQAGWKVASLLKYELFNGSTRVDGILCYQTTMGGQTELTAAFKTSGSANATVTKFSGELLLLKREEI